MSSSVVRPILLDHARQANRVATSMLKVDKEFGLMKYWGFSGYLKQRLSFGSSSSTTTTASTIVSTADDTPAKSGRIAFMLTAAMKTELADRLGYSPEDVKKMTPVQASLILNYSVLPAKMADLLPILEKDYHYEVEREQQQRKAEEEEKLVALQQQEKEKQQQSQEAPYIPSSTTVVGDASIYHKHRDIMSTTVNDGYASANILLHPTWGFGKTWFEVTEKSSADGESTRVGLYTDQDEAKLGMEARQYIADRESSPLTYELREVAADSLS
jgi:hypothetical protein